MRRLLFITLALALVLAGCGQQETPPRQSTSATAKLKAPALYLLGQGSGSCVPSSKPVTKEQAKEQLGRCPKEKFLLARASDQDYYLLATQPAIDFAGGVERMVLDTKDDRQVNVYLNSRGQAQLRQAGSGRYLVVLPRSGQLTRATVIASGELGDNQPLDIKTGSSDQAQDLLAY